jgi:diguanylate cyclase (GGDEF)-like protein
VRISDASKSRPPGAVASASGTAKAAKAAETAPVDEISISGIPDAELTPRVREALSALMREVQSLRAELAEARSRMGDLERLADSDPHLGVLNRRAFVRELNRALAMVERYGAPACLIFVDLNDLKKINDANGHAAGDAALQRVARVLSENIRQTDAVGRLGGDEFGVILTQTDRATAAAKAEALAALVAADPVAWRGGTFVANVACGVVEIAKGLSADEALESADNEMYRVKRRR